jgi:hypothetical protein
MPWCMVARNFGVGLRTLQLRRRSLLAHVTNFGVASGAAFPSLDASGI